MAFNPGGIPNPLLPAHLIPARLHGSHQRRASDPFNPTLYSRANSSTPTAQPNPPDTEQWQSMADLMRTSAAAAAASARPDGEANAGLIGAQSLDSMAYLRTASLPHVPTQPLTATGLIPPVETPAMTNPRESSDFC